MNGYDLVVRSRRAVTPDGERPAAVAVHDGRITAIAGYTEPLDTASEVELGEVALLPGLVDTHVHVNEPGRTEWEGFATATRAAAAGGVTTLLDMPLNSIPPTVDVPALELKRKVASGQCAVDVGFWGGAVPGNLDQLAALHEAGVFGFKCFLSPSGVDEFPPLSPDELECAAARVAEFDGLLIVHAEEPDLLAEAPASRRYTDFLACRPGDAEERAVARLVAVARRTGVRVHVLHVSSAGVLPILAAARAAGVPITAETCPHYLALAAEEVPDGATQAKCCPPIRDRSNQDALWQGLAGGILDCVVSDHSPCSPELKRPDTGDFGAAWGGISSVQLGLPVVWTAASARGFTLSDVVRWMAAAPARLAGLPTRGRLAAGCAADLVAFAPTEPSTVDPSALCHRHPVTPYAGRRLTGVVHRCWLRGREIGTEPVGRLLSRPDGRR